ncbi:hypothetical protein VTO42DRAFT_824 [Malbranchea cinnamomea]
MAGRSVSCTLAGDRTEEEFGWRIRHDISLLLVVCIANRFIFIIFVQEPIMLREQVANLFLLGGLGAPAACTGRAG